MTSPDLAAMIPVDRFFAQKKKHWEMPFDKLYTRLLTKTKGRILIADSRFPHETAPASQQPDSLTAVEWSAFQNRVRFSNDLRPSNDATTANRPLWVEISS